MTLPTLAPLGGAVQFRSADVDRIAERRTKLLAAYKRAGLAGEWRERLGSDQLAAALVAAEEALALKALVGHGNWGQWQREHLHPYGVKPKTMRDWVWVYERRHQIGDAANLTQAKAAIRAAELEAKRKRLREPGALPPGAFNLWDIDIPWWFPREQLTYEPMPRDEVLALMREVKSRAADDAVAMFWVPDAFVPEVFQVIEAAGFTFSGRFLVWVKDKGGPHQIACGRHELVAIATRGKPLFDPGPSTVIHAPRGEHSAKPIAAAKLFERLVPSSPATRIELFARRHRPGWVCWGDQLPLDEAAEPGAEVLPLRAAARPT